MTKPAITLRATKGSPLTYSELDANFTNLDNATVSLTAGTGGTQVTADLNGNITLVAGNNITLTGNNSTKTVTIDAGPTSITGLTNPLQANLDTYNYNLYNSLGSVTVNDTLVVQRSGVPEDNLKISNVADIVRMEGGSGQEILLATQYNNGSSTQYVGILIISGDPNAEQIFTLSPGYFGSVNSYTRIDTKGLSLNNVTTTERDNMLAQITATNYRNGMLVYNSTTNKFQGYANGTWVDLH